MAQRNLIIHQIIKQLSSTNFCASCAALNQLQPVKTGSLQKGATQNRLKPVGTGSFQKGATLSRLQPVGTSLFQNVLHVVEGRSTKRNPKEFVSDVQCQEQLSTSWCFHVHVEQKNVEYQTAQHQSFAQRDTFSQTSVSSLPLKAKYCAPKSYHKTCSNLGTNPSLALFDDGSQHFSGEYFARSLHTSSASCRKRKNKSSPSSNSESLDGDLGMGEEMVGAEHEYANEEHEYADEIHDYANEIVERGYQTVQGYRVLVIQPMLKNQPRAAHATECDLMLAEAKALVQTLQNWSVFESMLIPLRSYSKKHMFGQGTFQDLTAQIRFQPDITAVFLNVDRLSGVQKKTLEDEWGVLVLDRYELVLQIFKDHASTKEAKLQIALAEIQLKKTHIRQDVENLDQQSGAQQYIGGGGETLLEKKHRLLRDREGALKKTLEKLKRKRSLLRQGRQKKHLPHVAVVGYTNAGKTSLIKALTGDTKLQPLDQLFATLDVTSHAGLLPNRMSVIYVDTVGFISNLPHQLIASFAATLEDVLCADLILHVRDVSHPDSEAQRMNVLRVLHDLGVSQNLLDGMVEVNNKMDKLQDSSSEACCNGFLPVSATQGTGLNQLKEVIEVKLLEVTDSVKCEVRIPQAGTHLSWLYKEATVQDVSTLEGDAEHLIVDAVFSSSAYGRFQAKFGDLKVS